MKAKHYPHYAPDKHGPAAEKRKAESQAFIKRLMHKHGITEAELYKVKPRNRFHSELYK